MTIFHSPKYGEEYDRIDGLYVFGEEVDQRFGSLWQRSQYQHKEPLKAQGSGQWTPSTTLVYMAYICMFSIMTNCHGQ